MILTNLNSHTKGASRSSHNAICYMVFCDFLARFGGKHLDGTRWFGPLPDVLRKYDWFSCLFQVNTNVLQPTNGVLPLPIPSLSESPSWTTSRMNPRGPWALKKGPLSGSNATPLTVGRNPACIGCCRVKTGSKPSTLPDSPLIQRANFGFPMWLEPIALWTSCMLVRLLRIFATNTN